MKSRKEIIIQTLRTFAKNHRDMKNLTGKARRISSSDQYAFEFLDSEVKCSKEYESFLRAYEEMKTK
ncbi:hypothetical protein COV15_00140 [Candidatus Woesearchaeota archaeon CG10_big_fil_rev_8_21_14_0_10_34_12]|nr:MAG: hypothetical protein COV15_00140 [Candidatus Woesearchaeota archaeon CG10_big_fil_rev_8_21_14_0_10_34_12]